MSANKDKDSNVVTVRMSRDLTMADGIVGMGDCGVGDAYRETRLTLAVSLPKGAALYETVGGSIRIAGLSGDPELRLFPTNKALRGWFRFPYAAGRYVLAPDNGEGFARSGFPVEAV